CTCASSENCRLWPAMNQGIRPAAVRQARNHRFGTDPAACDAAPRCDALRRAGYLPGFLAITMWTSFGPDQKQDGLGQTKSDLGRKPAKSLAEKVNKTYALV